MKAKAFLRGLSWLLLLNVFIKPVWIFLIDRQVQNAVGQEAYGNYFGLFNLTYVLLFIADAGLANMLTQKAAARQQLNVAQLLRIKLLLLVVYALACTLVAWLTGTSQWNVLLCLILIQMLSSLFVFLRGLLTSSQLFTTDAFFSVLDKAVMIVLCAVPLYALSRHMSVLLFLRLQLVATTASLLLLLFVCFRKKLFQGSAQQASILYLLKQAVPFLAILLLMAAHYRLDGFLLLRLHSNGAKEAGIYAAAYRLLDAANMIGYLCASFLVPFLARQQRGKAMETVVLFMRHGLMLTALTIAVFVAVFAPWLQQLLYHANMTYNTEVIRLCLAVLPAYFLTHVYGSVLTAFASLRLFVTILVISVVTNVVLNALLIPAMGALGCCTAALVSQYACALLLLWAASQKFALRIGFRSIVCYAVFALACFFLCMLCKTPVIPIWIILVVGCLIAIVFFTAQKIIAHRLMAVFNS